MGTVKSAKYHGKGGHTGSYRVGTWGWAGTGPGGALGQRGVLGQGGGPRGPRPRGALGPPAAPRG